MPVIPMSCRANTQDPDEETGAISMNPWTVIEGAVRKVDESRVRDCTEDIDTLLVFAGLYSAVLTAFLIESYKNLQPDEGNDLLRQIAFQTANYSFQNGYLNTTFRPSQLPSFRASISDIRVNVCWFTSLILSLASASFGILVKQWFREYLSIDCINPKERLRIRHARAQGLQSWKLFEIAAILPVLLQVSLALFFVGLCFFTAAVHSSIGRASLILVVCWAIVISSVILAPLLSPRCPYNTKLLKGFFRRGRPYTRPFIYFIKRRTQRVYIGLIQLGLALPRWFYGMVFSPRSRPRALSAPKVNEATDHNSDWPSYWDDYMDVRVLQEFSLHVSQESPVTEEEEEEEDVRNTDRNDLVMLRTLDSSFLDDRLLFSMQQDLHHQSRDLDYVFPFVLAIVQSRLGFDFAGAALETIGKRQPWAWNLPRSTRVIIVDMLVESMRRELRVPDNMDLFKHTKWSVHFMFIIAFISPRDAMPSSVTSLFQDLDEYNRIREGHSHSLEALSTQMVSVSKHDPDWPARSLLFLAQSLKTLKAEDAEKALRYIVHVTFVNNPGPASEDTYHRLLAEPDPDQATEVIARTPHIVNAVLEVANTILHNYTLEQTQYQVEFPEEIRVLLEFTFEAILSSKSSSELYVSFRIPPTPVLNRAGLYQVLVDLFATACLTRPSLYFFSTNSQLLIASSPSIDTFFFPNLVHCLSPRLPREHESSILSACTHFFEHQAKLETPLAVNSPVILLRLCLLIFKYRTRRDQEMRMCWQQLCAAIYACHLRINDEYHDESTLACQYLTSSKHADTCETAHMTLIWCRHVQYKITDQLVSILQHYICTDHITGEERSTAAAPLN